MLGVGLEGLHPSFELCVSPTFLPGKGEFSLGSDQSPGRFCFLRLSLYGELQWLEFKF